MSNTPLISVLVPTYNQGPFIQDFFESMENQKFKDFELIFCNDGSDDNTQAVLGQYTNPKRLNIAVTHHDDNRGTAHAINTAFNASNPS